MSVINCLSLTSSWQTVLSCCHVKLNLHPPSLLFNSRSGFGANPRGVGGCARVRMYLLCLLANAFSLSLVSALWSRTSTTTLQRHTSCWLKGCWERGKRRSSTARPDHPAPARPSSGTHTQTHTWQGAASAVLHILSFQMTSPTQKKEN